MAKSRRRTMFGGLIFVAILLLAVAACSDNGSTESNGDSEPETSDKSVFDVLVGDCLVLQDFSSEETLYLEEVSTIDCTEFHDYEVVALFDAPDGTFPGEDALFDMGFNRCPPPTSAHLIPTSDSWTLEGDRVVACVVESIFNLRTGDCVNFTAESVELVSCGRVHDAEVVAVFDMPDSVFPGEDAVSAYANDRCPVSADTHAGPTRDSWELIDDREIVCFDEA